MDDLFTQSLFYGTLIILSMMVVGPFVWQWFVKTRSTIPKSPAKKLPEQTPERLADAASQYLLFLQDKLPSEAVTPEFMLECIADPLMDVETALRELVIRGTQKGE